jgi:TetR/AcrR family transcriptional repressor of nem operon
MRVSKQAAADNRQRILTAAAKLFREHGIGGAGVDAITSAAGLTHGAFYSQFKSKEAVVAESLRLSLDESRGLLPRDASGDDKSDVLEFVIDSYLSRQHRDSPGEGCVVAAVGSDIARQPRKVRRVFTKALGENLEALARLFPARTATRRTDEAIRSFSAMVGAVILARAVDDEALSRRILETVAEGLKAAVPS